jgi:hypothetical protein
MIHSLFLMVAAGADAAFLSACDKSLTSVLNVCNVLVPAFMSIALIITIGRGYLFGNGLAIDWSPLLRALFIFFILFFYKELIDTMSGGIVGMTYAVSPSTSAAEALAQLSPTAATTAATGTTTTGQYDVVQNSPSSLTTAWNLIANFGLSGIVTWLFTGTATLLVKTIMEFLQQFIVGFLYICGPIALSLSIIPAFGQLAMKWLQNYIAVQMWGLTFALLDLMYSHYAADVGPISQGNEGGFFGGLGAAFNNIFSMGAASSGSSTLYAARSCGFIIMYIMAPWLTSMIIGSSAAQGFIGSMVGAAASVAGVAAGVAAPPAAGGGASGALGRAMGFGGKSSSGGGGGGSSDSGSDSGGSTASAGPPSVTSAPPSNVRTRA